MRTFATTLLATMLVASAVAQEADRARTEALAKRAS